MSATGICCETCPCYVPNQPDPKGGVCRHGPPHPFLIPGPPNTLTPNQPNLRVQSVWPPVAADHWCSKHPAFGVGESMPIDRRLAGATNGEA